MKFQTFVQSKVERRSRRFWDVDVDDRISHKALPMPDFRALLSGGIFQCLKQLNRL